MKRSILHQVIGRNMDESVYSGTRNTRNRPFSRMMNSSLQPLYTTLPLKPQNGTPKVIFVANDRLTSAMDILVDRELQSREHSRQLLPDIDEVVINEDLPSDEQYQCSVC